MDGLRFFQFIFVFNFFIFLSKIGGGVNGGEVLVLVVLVDVGEVRVVGVEYAEPRLILVRALVQTLVKT